MEVRAVNYNIWARQKGYSGLVYHNGAVYGFWLLGQDYRNVSKYYGAYPAGYLQRIEALFSDLFERGPILHLFSGSIRGDCRKVWTVDIDPDLRPCVVASADNFAHLIPEDVRFSIVLADPPYAGNWEKYPKAKKVCARKVLDEVWKVTQDGGYLVWLDTHFPQFSSAKWRLRGVIGIGTSTNHVWRAATILQKRRDAIERSVLVHGGGFRGPCRAVQEYAGAIHTERER